MPSPFFSDVFMDVAVVGSSGPHSSSETDTPLLTVILVSHAYISLVWYQGYFDLLPLLSVRILVFNIFQSKTIWRISRIYH